MNDIARIAQLRQNASGITLSMWQKYEYGRIDISKAQAHTVLAIAKTLGATVEELLK